MKRHVTWILTALVVLAAAGAGVGAWRLARPGGHALPQITAYSRGTTVRVGPYLYCNVIDLNDCEQDNLRRGLSVSEHYPVQLSVPPEIARTPWRLLKVYADRRDTTTSHRPGTRLAVTVPTLDRTAAGWSVWWCSYSPWSRTRTAVARPSARGVVAAPDLELRPPAPGSGVQFAGHRPHDLRNPARNLAVQVPAAAQLRLHRTLEQGDHVLDHAVQFVRAVLVLGRRRLAPGPRQARRGSSNLRLSAWGPRRPVAIPNSTRWPALGSSTPSAEGGAHVDVLAVLL